MKIRPTKDKISGDGTADFFFFCPACNIEHEIWLVHPNDNTHKMWGFDGNMERPTISGSVLTRHTKYETDKEGMPIPETIKDFICHSVITNGMIAFQGDCNHAFAGKTVELPEL